MSPQPPRPTVDVRTRSARPGLTVRAGVLTVRAGVLAALAGGLLLLPASPAAAAGAPAAATVALPRTDQPVLQPDGSVRAPGVAPVTAPVRSRVAPTTADPDTGRPAPVVRPTPAVPSSPNLQINVGGKGDSPLNSPLTLVLLLGSISLIPALMIMATAFTRIVIVLGFVRSALGTNGIPPNQVIIGLSLFLSLFVMAPTFSAVNAQAVQPFAHGQITQAQALDRGMVPFRTFMLKQVRQEDLAMFIRLSGDARPAKPTDVKTTTLAPAFMLSELRTAFLIGFVIFIPFIVIDLIVSAALSAIGMVMLPPVLISLPFKLLLFVAADGWSLVVSSLVASFKP